MGKVESHLCVFFLTKLKNYNANIVPRLVPKRPCLSEKDVVHRPKDWGSNLPLNQSGLKNSTRSTKQKVVSFVFHSNTKTARNSMNFEA